jgi:hypothetical protein
MSGRNEVESEFPEFSALGDHNHARRCARNTVSKTEQISLRNLPNVGTGLEATNSACGRSPTTLLSISAVIAGPIWFAKCPSAVGRIVGAEFSSVGRDAGAESTASEGSFIQFNGFLSWRRGGQF